MAPKALQDRPTLARRWEFPKAVFDALHGSRNYTAGGAANIPFSEYERYARAYGFSRLELIDVWEDLLIIDNIWLAKVAEKQAVEKNST